MKKRDRVHVRQANISCREFEQHEQCTGIGWDLSTDDPCPCPCPCHQPPAAPEEPLWLDDM